MKVVLISPYELGRQPFGLAQPAAWLADDDFEVDCIDLSLESLSRERLADSQLVAVHLAMHTATRIAIEALPRLRSMAPSASFCAYGLYAAPNADMLFELGFDTVLGGECEPDLIATARRIRESGRELTPAAHSAEPAAGAVEALSVKALAAKISVAKIPFMVPDRSHLPALSRYASLILPGDKEARLGFTEGSRGCKHLCRHCPVVPTYQGRFRIVPVDIVMADIRGQVAAGAEHISFGDPDFLNGPTHARRLLEAFSREFPGLTFDCTIKVEHLLADPDILGTLVASGCRFVTTAVEAVDNEILEILDKGHSVSDFEQVVSLARKAGLELAPTFVPFTPWTSLDGYIELLDKLAELELVYSVPPVQLSIRLLVPAGSRLLELSDFNRRIGAFDPTMLGYPWAHDDPRVDQLASEVQTLAMQAEEEQWTRRDAFERIRGAAYAAAGRVPSPLPAQLGHAIARHSEPWYCCAEPTSAQLEGF